jgi:hypothetical protein
MEVMVASTILSVLVLGMSSFWFSAAQRTSDLVLRQKAMFVLNAEIERLSALYIWTGFGADAVSGPQTSTGYVGLAGIPATRLIYAADIGPLMPSTADNFITSTAATFLTGSEFLVWLEANPTPALNRAYVWIDRARNITGRLSWSTSDIIVNSCIDSGNCWCLKFTNATSAGGRCRTLNVYVEYPYRFDASGTIIAPAKLETISLRTIVGRG